MKKKRINYFRLALQWIILVLLAYMVIRPLLDTAYTADFEAYCPLGGLQALSGYLVTDNLACSMTSMQITMGIALVLCILIFSKLFCSYLCPVGTFTEWLGKLGEKLKIRFTIKGFADRSLRILKYALLFLTFYFTIKSSELFCKKFDPYYAAFSGFSSDVVVWYAVIALLVVVLGSFFIRQFWCKYLCPLSAATNIFTNFILFITIIGIYLLLHFVFNISISWVWLLTAIVTLSFLKETIFMKVTLFPLLKVTRNPDTCTLCKKCDKVCTMAIKISESGRVNHIDCHLCGDCVVECPEKDTLRINRRRMLWVPPVAVVVLIALSLWFSSFTEIPTINERWGTPEQFENAKVYKQTGIKNIKCYGSSMSFAEQMKNIKGVLGVETFVGSHTVKIFYDPSLINEEGIKKAIFTPSSEILNETVASEIGVMEISIQNYFDSFDEYNFTKLLSANPAIYGFSTSFGEPVCAKIYFDFNRIKPLEIIKIIETPEIKIDEQIQHLDFKVKNKEEKFLIISKQKFYTDMYPPMDDKFNKFSTYKISDLSMYEIPLTSHFNKEISEQLVYMESHLSNDEGIVGFKTKYDNDSIFVNITFVKTKTNSKNIFSNLNSSKMKIYFDDGTSEERNNPFKFEKEGKVIN